MDDSTTPPTAMQSIVAGIVEIEQAGRLEEFLTDAWHRVHIEAEDREHCQLGHGLYVDRMADIVVKLLDVTHNECAAALEAVVLKTKRQVVAETVWLQLGPTMRQLYGRLRRTEVPQHHRAVIATLRAGDEPGLRLAVRTDVTQGLRMLVG